MKLQFKHQKFQADAAKAVVDVFAGQPYLTPTYLMDRGSDTHQLTLEEIEGNREAARGYAAIGRDLAEQGILYWGADIPADARTIALAQD